MVDAVGKGSAIEISILWYRIPVVVEGILLCTLSCHIETVLHEQPLSLAHLALTLYTIIIGIGLVNRFHTPIL